MELFLDGYWVCHTVTVHYGVPAALWGAIMPGNDRLGKNVYLRTVKQSSLALV